jgi:uncharacterized small protein (DUF1192 family)
MTRSKLLPALFGIALLTACGPTQVVVTAELTEQGAEARALGDLEIRMFPYDRDALFDSLTAAAERPEPAIPDSVLDAQNQVATAQQSWREMEARWSILRDTLQTISAELEQLSRGQAAYRALFRDFGDMESELADVERQRDAAFENFTSLQSASMAAAEQIRVRRDQWADDAFTDVTLVMSLAERASGLSAMSDTTDASGLADSFLVNAGDYWVNARYELPYTELYWNVPVTVGSEPAQVRLTEANATVRPKL